MIYKSHTNKIRIKVLGAGPTGSILALALANIGSDVTIFDTQSVKQIKSRDRAYALTQSTKNLFEKLGIWQDLYSILTPFEQLIIEDRECDSFIDMNYLNLPYSNNNEIGWIIEHCELMDIVVKHLYKSDNIITNYNTQASIDIGDFDLVIAADGHNSTLRNKIDINLFRIKYSQSCLTAKVLIRGAKSKVAYEVFRHEGPLAVLPMSNNIYQIVWSAPTSLCKKRSKLVPSIFLDKLAAILPTELEPDILIDEPSVFPLHLSIAMNLFKGRVLLIGESAHSIHPVGGQGLNLCLRDVNGLTNIVEKFLEGSIKLHNVPVLYERTRFIDIVLISFFTDFLVRYFSNRFLPLILIRRISILIINKFQLMKKLFLNLMTYGYTNSLIINIFRNDD